LPEDRYDRSPDAGERVPDPEEVGFVNETGAVGRPYPIKLVLAFASVYIIWGSTYLAIRYAIATLPPLLMASIRFFAAGSILYAWARVRGAAHPTLPQWKAAAVIGAFLLLGGNGAVVWAEQRVPSGLTALLVATEPLWVVLLDGLRKGGVRPDGRTIVGLIFGFFGMLLLVGPSRTAGGGPVEPLGAALLVTAALSWAAGSLYSLRARLSPSPLMNAGMQMLCGASLLLAAGSVSGEWSRFSLQRASPSSWIALLYLVIFGSLVGFTSYTWLLQAATPSHVATYAYVNPLVAVFLGWLLAGELLTVRILVAATVITTAVVIITSAQTARWRKRKTPRRSG
jgi:drug/metabolite transporter (DMT)-like permease